MNPYLKRTMAEATEYKSEYDKISAVLFATVNTNKGMRSGYAAIDRTIDSIITELSEYSKILSLFKPSGLYENFKRYYEPILDFFTRQNYQYQQLNQKIAKLTIMVEEQNKKDSNKAQGSIDKNIIHKRINHGVILQKTLKDEILPLINRLVLTINRMIFFEEILNTLKYIPTGPHIDNKDLKLKMFENVIKHIVFYAKYNSMLNHRTLDEQQIMDLILMELENIGFKKRDISELLEIHYNEFSSEVLAAIKKYYTAEKTVVPEHDTKSTNNIVRYNRPNISIQNNSSYNSFPDSLFKMVSDILPIFEKGYANRVASKLNIDKDDIATSSNRVKFYENNHKTAGLQETAEILNGDLIRLNVELYKAAEDTRTVGPTVRCLRKGRRQTKTSLTSFSSSSK